MNDIDIVVLRFIHILLATFWVGNSLFRLLLEPRLRVLEPDAQRQAFEALRFVVSRTQNRAGLAAIVAGVLLALRMRWGNFDAFYTTGWGWAMIAAFVAAVISNNAPGPAGPLYWRDRILSVRRSFEGRAPTEEERLELERLTKRNEYASYFRTGLLVAALASMTAARFI